MQRSRFTTDAPITSASSTSNSSIGSTTTTTASLNAYFSNVEEELNKKLDNEIDQFVVSFRDIVKGSGIRESIRVPGRDTDKSVEKDKYKNALDGLVDELRAANMVRCCESLLSLTHDLKTTLLLNDTQTLLKLRENRKNDLLSQTQKIKNKVLQLNEAVTQAIWEMESVLGGEGGSNQQLDPSKM
nr:11699_t:CDS:2 [Entrophospora candida]CAG8602834.1 13939_t:CDS:2 [Entrophospora candida]